MKRWIAALMAVLVLCSALALAEEAAPATEQPTAAPTQVPTAEATQAPTAEATAAPSDPTPEAEPAQWLLTIRYLYEDRTEALPEQQLTLVAGAAYDVEIPEVEGFVPDVERVQGTMPAENWTVEVIYRVGATATPGASAEATAMPAPSAEATVTPAPSAEATVAPGASAEPTATPEPGAGWTLTIQYVLFTGEPAAADAVLTGLTAGQTYDVESPIIEGMTADQLRVTGVMGEADVTVVVTYSATGDFGGFPGGFPGGGFGGSRPQVGMTGEEGLEAGDVGFQVTPGEAFTSIHSSGDKDDSLYGVLDPDDEAAVAELNLSLTVAGTEQAFTAEWSEGALILTGDAGQWNLGGDALRALKASGVDTLVLISGGDAVALPTGGFASGYAYDCLRAQGLASAQYAYAVDPAAQTVQLTAQQTTYELAAEGGDMQLTGAAFDTSEALRAQYAAEGE